MRNTLAYLMFRVWILNIASFFTNTFCSVLRNWYNKVEYRKHTTIYRFAHIFSHVRVCDSVYGIARVCISFCIRARVCVYVFLPSNVFLYPTEFLMFWNYLKCLNLICLKVLYWIINYSLSFSFWTIILLG